MFVTCHRAVHRLGFLEPQVCSIRRFDFIVIHKSVTSVAVVASHIGMQEVGCVVMYSLQVGKNQSEERRSLHERNHTHGICTTTNRTDEPD